MAGRKPTVSDHKILHEMHTHEHPFVVATDLTETLDMGRQGVLKRLDKLADSDDGYVVRAEKPNVNIYLFTPKGRQHASDYSGGNDPGSQ